MGRIRLPLECSNCGVRRISMVWHNRWLDWLSGMEAEECFPLMKREHISILKTGLCLSCNESED